VRTFGAAGHGATGVSGRTFGAAGGRGGEGGFGHGGGHGALEHANGHYMYHGHEMARFRGDHYRWPHGYGYHRWYAHGYLPRAFWMSDYWVSDWADYGVDAPCCGWRWIRYGPDLLLINPVDGQIQNVVPGVFVEG
jgi:Ni/Co efflux regulator RcnB